ncbi:MAG: hypothetical protein AAGB93_09905 [Planctomycetota bacterium]
MNQPSPDPAPSGARASRAILLVGTAAAIALLLALRTPNAFLVDDAFISFRFARNWTEWGVPAFNAFELAPGGRPVEGYSNLLWTASLALMHGAGADLPSAAGALQAALGAATVAWVALFAHRRLGLGTVGVLAAPVLLATSAPFVAWSSGGMETTLFALLLTGLLTEALTPRSEGVRGGIALGVWAVGVALVRAEGPAWVLGTLGAVLAAERLALRGDVALTRRRIGVALAALGAATLAVLAWRQAVYGAWLPNTVTAKTGGGVDALARGARQVASWGLVTITPALAPLALVPALRHRSPGARAAALAGLGGALGGAIYSVAVGGDWMPFFRFLAPVAPALAIVIAVGLDAAPRAIGASSLAALAALQPLALFDVHVAPEPARAALRFRAFRGGYASEASRVATARENADRFERLGAALAAGTAPGDVLAFGPIGSTGWFAPALDFVDRNGLVTPSVAARAVEPGSGTAGHEKRVPHAWFLDGGAPAPRYLFATLLEGRMDPEDPRHVAQARDAIRGLLGGSDRAEGPLYRRTVLRAVPILEGRAEGCTLLLLERADPVAAAAFWGA